MPARRVNGIRIPSLNPTLRYNFADELRANVFTRRVRRWTRYLPIVQRVGPRDSAVFGFDVLLCGARRRLRVAAKLERLNKPAATTPRLSGVHVIEAAAATC